MNQIILFLFPVLLFGQASVPISPPTAYTESRGEPTYYLTRSFEVAPIWLSNDQNPTDRVVFYLSTDGEMGIGSDYIQAWNTERAATFSKSLESVSCWLMDVWKIQIENEKLEYISVRDGKTRSLRIIKDNKIITYSTLPTVYYARVKQ